MVSLEVKKLVNTIIFPWPSKDSHDPLASKWPPQPSTDYLFFPPSRRDAS